MNNINEVTVVISHPHEDHYNLYEPFENFIKQLSTQRIKTGKKGIEILTTIHGWEEKEVEQVPLALDKTMLITPFVSNSGRTIHDKCLVLKIQIPNNGAILLTGDASGRSCDELRSKYPDFFKDVCVLLLSHHGSSQERALLWFESCMMGMSKPFISIISSNPYGRDHIPTYETIIKLLDSYPKDVMSLFQQGFCFCAYHHLDCYHSDSEKIITLPAISPNIGVPLPIFITSQSIENHGDGIYRIKMQSNGCIYMGNNPCDNYQYTFSPTRNTEYVLHTLYQMYLASSMQRSIIKEKTDELKVIAKTNTAGQLQELRTKYATVSSAFPIDSYLADSLHLQSSLAQQSKKEQEIRTIISTYSIIHKAIFDNLISLTQPLFSSQNLYKRVSLSNFWKSEYEWQDFLVKSQILTYGIENKEVVNFLFDQLAGLYFRKEQKEKTVFLFINQLKQLLSPFTGFYSSLYVKKFWKNDSSDGWIIFLKSHGLPIQD